MEQVYFAMSVLDNALAHKWRMLAKVDISKKKLDRVKNLNSVQYHELLKKYHEAVAAHVAAEQAIVDSKKELDEIEKEYYDNLKCTFCGDLDSICGGDHSEEMRYLSQKRY